MKLETRKIPENEPETVEIRYHWITDEIQEIVSFVKSRQGQLSATRDGKRFEVPVVDLFYAESVDDRLFLYTSAEKQKLPAYIKKHDREPDEDLFCPPCPERPVFRCSQKWRRDYHFPEICTGTETDSERQ